MEKRGIVGARWRRHARSAIRDPFGFDIAHVQMFKNPLLASKAPQDIIGQGLLFAPDLSNTGPGCADRRARIRWRDLMIAGISGGMIVPSGITSPVESSSRYSGALIFSEC